MLNRSETINLDENGSQIELITKKRINNMSNKTKPTRISVLQAGDLFRLAKMMDKKNQLIIGFELEDVLDINNKEYMDIKHGVMFGNDKYIKNITTAEFIKGKGIERLYSFKENELKLKEEKITYTK
jgi:hypothetical protein